MRIPQRVAILKLLGTLSVFLICYSWIARPALLYWGAAPDEIGRTWPGQDLFRSPGDGVEPSAGSVRAVTIAAPPAQVWSWLAQIGQSRGGFYSYAWLENLLGCGIVNAARIHPEWQSLQVGEKIYLAPSHRFGGQAFLVAARVEPQKSLVLVSPQDWNVIRDGGRARGFVWSIELREESAGKTRLVARSAGEHSWAALAFWEPAHFVMERAMLLGILQRAESNRPAGTRWQVDWRVKCEHGLCGYADTAGVVRIPLEFVAAGPFENGMAVVATRVVAGLGGAYERRYGAIDASGAFVIPPAFRFVSHFREGIAIASLDGRTFGYIDRRGLWVLPPRFAEAADFHDGLAVVLPLDSLDFARIDTEGRDHSNAIKSSE